MRTPRPCCWPGSAARPDPSALGFQTTFRPQSWPVCLLVAREGPCFVCAILAGHPDYPHHDVYEDDATIAFLARQPTLLGYCIVAPKRHVEDWVGGLGEEEYLALQRVVHRVAGAVAQVVPVERMYFLSLGS